MLTRLRKLEGQLKPRPQFRMANAYQHPSNADLWQCRELDGLTGYIAGRTDNEADYRYTLGEVLAECALRGWGAFTEGDRKYLAWRGDWQATYTQFLPGDLRKIFFESGARA